jgi:hypothetical protein
MPEASPQPCPEDRGKLLNQPDTVKRESSRGEIFVIVLNLMWRKNALHDLETRPEMAQYRRKCRDLRERIQKGKKSVFLPTY